MNSCFYDHDSSKFHCYFRNIVTSLWLLLRATIFYPFAINFQYAKKLTKRRIMIPFINLCEKRESGGKFLV